MSLFVREDWTLFRTIEGLRQRAGVREGDLPKLAIKELADNAMDAAGSCVVGYDPAARVFSVQDSGPGLPVEALATLFSVRRPLTSSKLLRLPTRGALGNGLRVVVGLVMARDGVLVAETRGKRVTLRPNRETGDTDVEDVEDVEPVAGLRVELHGLRITPHTARFALSDALWSAGLAGAAPGYAGKSSPHWYTEDAFSELLAAAGDRPVREVIADLDGCSGGKAGKIADGFQGRGAATLSKAECAQLLVSARRGSRPVSARRLGSVGETAFGDVDAYSCAMGDALLDALSIPCVVEVWGLRGATLDPPQLFVNRTPTASDFQIDGYDDGDVIASGGGFRAEAKGDRRDAENWRLWVNITTPYMPILSDGKSPNLQPFAVLLGKAFKAVVGKLKRGSASLDGGERVSQKDVVLAVLDDACVAAGGGHPFSQRQLFYQVRPHLLAHTGREPDYGYFCAILTEYEDENGDIPGLERDPRGVLYHPHERREIPIGTRSVAEYGRPEWTFNKILFSEKEGFFSVLKAEQWPERNDCALLTSKGFASRAARDLLDFLGDSGEPIKFYCIHDADAAGTMIFQSLQGATRARGNRRVEIINLGLEPWEAREMGLSVETFRTKGQAERRRFAVADYVPPDWSAWLQHSRVELNAMSTPQFLAWLNGKMASHAEGKLVPPDEILAGRLRARARALTRAKISERILQDAGIDGQVEDAMGRAETSLRVAAGRLRRTVAATFSDEPALPWVEPVERVADELTRF